MNVSKLLNNLGLYATNFNKEETSYRGDKPIYVAFAEEPKEKYETTDIVIATDESLTILIKKRNKQ